MGGTGMSISRTAAIVVTLSLASILLPVSASTADAAARSWDRQVTDSVGRIDIGTISNTDSAMDGDFVYWSTPTGKRPLSKQSIWVLRRMTISTGKVRTIATVRNGVFGSVHANAGRVSYSTHRRQRSRQGGKLVTTKSTVFSMAATDPRPKALVSGSAVSRFELRRRRRRNVTDVVRTCGNLPMLVDVSDTGQTLTISRTLRCRGSAVLPRFRLFKPGSATPANLGLAGSSFQAAIRQGKLIDLGDDYKGNRRASIKNLSTGTVSFLPDIGDFASLITSPFGSFAIRSSFYTSDSAGTQLRVYSLDTGARTGQFVFDDSREIHTFALCPDAIAQVRESLSSTSAVVFRDASGKVLGRQKRAEGDSLILRVACVGRTVSIAELPAAADGTLRSKPRLVNYAF